MTSMSMTVASSMRCRRPSMPLNLVSGCVDAWGHVLVCLSVPSITVTIEISRHPQQSHLYMLPLTSTRKRNCFLRPSLGGYGSPAEGCKHVHTGMFVEVHFQCFAMRKIAHLGGDPALHAACIRCVRQPKATTTIRS